MICDDCRKPQGVLRDDAKPQPDDDQFCWRHVNAHAPCVDDEDMLDEIKRLRAENSLMREALLDIAAGDYSDPFCKRTPEQRARDALKAAREA